MRPVALEDVLVLSDPDVRVREERFRSADQASRHADRAEAAALTAEIEATCPLERLGDRIDAQARAVARRAETERLRRESDVADTFATHPRFIISVEVDLDGAAIVINRLHRA